MPGRCRAAGRGRQRAVEADARLPLRPEPGAPRRMRRALLVILVLAAAGAFVLTNTGAGGENDSRRFTVELDNAFGLVKGADLKIAGVRAGSIEKLRLDRRTRHALVDFKVDKTGFEIGRA